MKRAFSLVLYFFHLDVEVVHVGREEQLQAAQDLLGQLADFLAAAGRT